MIDPDGSQLAEVAAAVPCVWRGSVLSLGSVEQAGGVGVSAAVLGRLRSLVERTGARLSIETIGWRRRGGRDLGVALPLPWTMDAAAWVARRRAEASRALGVEVLLQLADFPAAVEGGMGPGGFLGQLARYGCSLVLEAGALARLSAWPAGDLAAMALSGDGEAEWGVLAASVAQRGVRAVVLRRERNLFPLDSVGLGIDRAAAILAQAPAAEMARAAVAEAPVVDQAGLAALEAEQAGVMGAERGPGKAVCAWSNWHRHAEDTHTAQQIAAFLAGGPRRSAVR